MSVDLIAAAARAEAGEIAGRINAMPPEAWIGTDGGEYVPPAAVALIAAALEPRMRHIDMLLSTRRNVHLALGKAGIRTHYLAGEDPAHPMGREVGAVERVEMLVEEVLRLRKAAKGQGGFTESAS